MGNHNRFYADIMAMHNEVTGSGILIIVKYPDNTTERVLIDCGLFQESAYSSLNNSFPFTPSNIDHVIITHNHVDHTGRLPLLVKNGYKGYINMSQVTTSFIRYALEDSYKVLRSKAKMANTYPIYSYADVEETFHLVKGHPFEETFSLGNNIKLTFFSNGHLPGAVVGLLQISYTTYTQKHYDDINILFTGDYNNKNMFFDVRSLPSWVTALPLTIIQEATYGNMDSTNIEYVFEKNILDAIQERKNIIIPVFSLGRSQEIMYLLRNLQDSGKLDPNIPIYFDGKLGHKYTLLYLQKNIEINEECKDFLPYNFTFVTDCGVRNHIIEDTSGSKIILTTSGMGSYGPAQTYIPAFLRRPNALIHFTGYVAEGTLGRRLYDCPKEDIISVGGLEVKKRADIKFTSEFSAHAKADELLDFLKQFKNIKFVLVNHGSTEAKDAYAKRIVDELDPKNVGILNRDYFFRINGYGLIKTMSTKFQ